MLFPEEYALRECVAEGQTDAIAAKTYVLQEILCTTIMFDVVSEPRA